MFCCKLRKSNKTYEDIPDKVNAINKTDKMCNRCGNNGNTESLCSLCILSFTQNITTDGKLCMDAIIESSCKQRLCMGCDIDISYLPEGYRRCRKCFPSPNFCVTCRKPIIITKSYCHDCSKNSTSGSL